MRMLAMAAHAVELSIDRTQSLARRRHLPSHAKVRSTTQQRGNETCARVGMDYRITGGFKASVSNEGGGRGASFYWSGASGFCGSREIGFVS